MTDDERRRFFRIDDEIAMSFTLIGDEYGGDDTDEQIIDANQEFHMSLEVQIRQAMVEVRSQNSKVAQVLDLMNQKINLLRSNELVNQQQPLLKMANVSACGIAFPWHEKIAINQQVMLNLYLQPKHELIRAQAHVAAVNVNKNEETRKQEPYIIHLDFNDIHRSYQEILIQHVVQRQGLQLRKKLEERK